jgi:hypothetical protein
MKFLELELARIAVQQLSRAVEWGTEPVRPAIEAYEAIVRADETFNAAERAGLVLLRIGGERGLAALYSEWLELAERIETSTANERLAARLQHALTQASDWLEVHEASRYRPSRMGEGESLVLL